MFTKNAGTWAFIFVTFKQDVEKLYQVKDEEIYFLNLSNRSFFAVQEYSIF